jgi:hypothetical protein
LNIHASNTTPVTTPPSHLDLAASSDLPGFTGLTAFAGLPKILSGPQVRRCETDKVWVWLATSAPAELTLTVFTAHTQTAIGRSIASQVKSVQLGEALHVHLVPAVPFQGEFARDTLLAYDLLVDGQNLAEHGLTGAQGITLAGHELPTFLIASSHASHVLLGSCRKPHGGYPNAEGQTEDALAYAAELLDSTGDDPARRPSVLLGLGDQIYADDVAGTLMESVKPLAMQLMGGDEHMPQLTIPLNKLGFGARQSLIKKHGFTSDHGEHHLLGLGELAAMYLITQGGLPCTLQSWSAVQGKPAYRGPAEASAAQLSYEGSAIHLQSFLQGTQAVRRLLANIVSYNIFDDHEVSDDWNLDKRMADALKKPAFGQRFLSNALIAYWAFQGWGNDPQAFSDEFLDTIRLGARESAATSTTRAALDVQMRNFHQWQFVAPTQPPIIFLDTRTQRKFSGSLHLAELQNERALTWLAHALAHIKSSSHADDANTTAYIVAPTPVYGITPIEFAQGTFKKWLTLIGRRAAAIDCESWITVREGFFNFMQCLLDSGIPKFVVLSGDVHYGFAKSGVFEYEGRTCSVTQLCSSALHNHPPSSAVLFWIGLFEYSTERRVGFVGSGLVASVQRWLRSTLYDFPVYFGWWRPNTHDSNTWFDIARVLPLSDRDCRLVTASHIGWLEIQNNQPVSYAMRYRSETNIARTLLG